MPGMFNSIGPALASMGLAPRFTASLNACCASLHAERHGVGAGAVLVAEDFRLAALFAVQEKVDVALFVMNDVFGAVLANRRKAELFEQRASSSGLPLVYSTNSKPSVPMGFSKRSAMIYALS